MCFWSLCWQGWILVPLRPQNRHMAANTVDSISMFLTPASYAFLRYSSFSSWEKEHRAPSSRPWPAEIQHWWHQNQLLWKTQAWHACDGGTFVEVMGTHGVSDHCGEKFELRGALQELIGDPLIQLSAPGDDLSQHHLLKLGAEGIVHCFIGDHHRPRSQACRRRQSRMSDLSLYEYHRRIRSSPTPPDVPRRNSTTSRHWAWCSSLMSSCSIIEMEGTPIPCCDEDQNRQIQIICTKIMFSKNNVLDTYADRENRTHFIHAVTICSLTYILDLFRVPRQFQLLVHELSKSLHSVGTATHTHKLLEKEIKQ